MSCLIGWWRWGGRSGRLGDSEGRKVTGAGTTTGLQRRGQGYYGGDQEVVDNTTRGVELSRKQSVFTVQQDVFA
jgi:hypothetical protein